MTFERSIPVRSFALVLDPASTDAGTRLWRHWAMRASRTGGAVSCSEFGTPINVLSPTLVSWHTPPSGGEDLTAAIAAAGSSIEALSATLADVAARCPILIWPDGRLQDLIALAYACEQSGGRGGIETVLMDLGPAELNLLDSPLGRAILARCEAVMAAGGVRLYLVARERSSQDILADCTVRRIRPPIRLIQHRRAPGMTSASKVTDILLHLGSTKSNDDNEQAPHQLFAEAFARRRSGPVTIRLVGSEGRIARLGPWIEDCIECDIGVDVKLEGAIVTGPGEAGLSWLSASPILHSARREPEDGVQASYRRTGSSSGDPIVVLSALLDRVAPFPGVGFKDLSRPNSLLRLDQRAHT